MKEEKKYQIELEDIIIKFGLEGKGSGKIRPILVRNWITKDELFEKIEKYFKENKIENFRDLQKSLYKDLMKNSEKFNLNPKKKIQIYIQKLKDDKIKFYNKKPVYSSSRVRIAYFDKNGKRVNTSLLPILLELIF